MSEIKREDQMRKKRNIIVLISCIIMSMCFSSCNSQESNDKKSEKTENSGIVESLGSIGEDDRYGVESEQTTTSSLQESETTSAEIQTTPDQESTKKVDEEDETAPEIDVEQTISEKVTTEKITTNNTTEKSTAEKITTEKVTSNKATENTTTSKPEETTTKEQETTTDNNVNTTETYTVNIHTRGGMALSDIDVYIYEDSSLTKFVDCTTTDSVGMAKFSLTKSSKYSIAISGVAKGYDVKTSYSFNGTSANIVLTSSVIKESISGATLSVGDVMHDITVENTDGIEYTISELLMEKDMVMLNFWFANCGYCIQEFPYIDEAYTLYKDEIEILAVNPFDSAANIDYVEETYGMTFPLTICDYSVATAFGVSGYPTTVIIDRYGVICFVEAGGRPYTSHWTTLFEHFTSDAYVQKILYNGINDLY